MPLPKAKPSLTPEPARATDAQWLARMRWGAIAIEAISVVVAERVLGLELPMGPIWVIVAIGVASNLWLTFRSTETLGAFLVLDVALLSALLYVSGGPTNPFSVVYVVYIAMSAVMLPARWTWAIAALSMLSFAGLFSQMPSGSAAMMHHGDDGDFQAHLYGMFVAFALSALLIAYFVSRLSDALRERERALAEAQERTFRWGRLASIATLAAGAAHELGTPLGTIAVAATELRRRAGELKGGDIIVEDAVLIHEELERCRAVLDRMALAGGEHVGEASASLDVDGLVDEVRDRLRPDQAERWETRIQTGQLTAPREAILQLIENIARNGFDACERGRVSLDVERRAAEVELRFGDEGCGMSPEVQAKAIDPFFTTKGSGDRMGLGLFLAHTLVDSLGGRLAIDSTVGHGTTIRVFLPQPT
ncbi:MAG: ATP-binding protein [Polyangiales bacterium]